MVCALLILQKYPLSCFRNLFSKMIDSSIHILEELKVENRCLLAGVPLPASWAYSRLQQLWRKASGQPARQRDGPQGFQAANTGADVRLSFFPPVIHKVHSSIRLEVRDLARIPESGNLHKATEQKVENTGIKAEDCWRDLTRQAWLLKAWLLIWPKSYWELVA